jgi:hypothetical protein
MGQFIQDTLDEAPESMAGMETTPSINHLFDVNVVNPTLLVLDEAKAFYHLLAKLLFYVSKEDQTYYSVVFVQSSKRA